MKRAEKHATLHMSVMSPVCISSTSLPPFFPVGFLVIESEDKMMSKIKFQVMYYGVNSSYNVCSILKCYNIMQELQ